jgi:hypothetical protein
MLLPPKRTALAVRRHAAGESGTRPRVGWCVATVHVNLTEMRDTLNRLVGERTVTAWYTGCDAPNRNPPRLGSSGRQNCLVERAA